VNPPALQSEGFSARRDPLNKNSQRNFAHKISISRLKIGMYDTSNHIHENLCLALLGLCTASEFPCFSEVGGGLAIIHKEELAKFGYMSDRKCLVFHIQPLV
jgi:hypothetical protein